MLREGIKDNESIVISEDPDEDIKSIKSLKSLSKRRKFTPMKPAKKESKIPLKNQLLPKLVFPSADGEGIVSGDD